jgi:hypothetical protein
MSGASPFRLGPSQLGIAPEQIFIRVRGNPYFKQDKTRDFRIRFQLSSEDKAYDKQKVASVLFRLYAGPKDPDVYPPKPEAEASSYRYPSARVVLIDPLAYFLGCASAAL